MKAIPSLPLVVFLASVSLPAGLHAQGMPPEARKNIHELFDNHTAIRRTVTATPEGYVAMTESADPRLAQVLREHVRQMESRLKEGLGVRRHDPAFAEFAAHYADMKVTVEPTPDGVKVTVVGTTPAAVEVARNHASVVSDCVAKGWEAHDRNHPAVRTRGTTGTPNPDGASCEACDARRKDLKPGGKGRPCCQDGSAH